MMRRLIGRPPFSDLFGAKGRRWLCGLALPQEERESVDSALRQIEFLDSEIEAVERLISAAALESAEVRRLMTVPGVNGSARRPSSRRSARSAASPRPGSWPPTSGSIPR